MRWLGMLAWVVSGSALAQEGSPALANTWAEAKPTFKLPKDVKDAQWTTGDGFSDNVYRSKTGTLLIRTGIDSKSVGYSPGYYSNTTVEWNLKTNQAETVDVANWSGGSYGHGKLLPAFKDRPTPSPRHTYDGLAYVESEDALYMMCGANWKTCLGEGVDPEAKEELKKDNASTWKFSFVEKRWTRIDGSIRQFWDEYKSSPYESHLRYWPEGGKLLFLNDSGRLYAEFDLKTQKWEKAELKGKCPMTLYEARSTWDSKRALWVFRLGPKLCTFDPKAKEFKELSNAYELSGDKKDPRGGMKGITYISKHDVYLINGPTAEDTWVYDPIKSAWSQVKAGGPKLVNGYLQYDAQTDLVVLSYQLTAFTFHYQP
ncbi:MAG: hypothetical protein HY291_19210 [Planctomycetes bacterium]|nr:hypothetical protein [Planctomycetota bacterium]